MFHKDCKLRFLHAEVHLCYDGSLRLSTNAEIIGPDGKRTEMRHGNTHRISPHHPHHASILAALRPAVEAHHAQLGLHLDDDSLPLPLHPVGYVAFPQAKLQSEPQPEAMSHDELRERIVRAKEAELGTPIPPEAHPKLEETP